MTKPDQKRYEYTIIFVRTYEKKMIQKPIQKAIQNTIQNRIQNSHEKRYKKQYKKRYKQRYKIRTKNDTKAIPKFLTDSLDNLASILNISGQNYNIDDHSIFKFKMYFSLCKSL